MATSRGWVYDPTRGGTKISSREQQDTERRIRAFAAKHFAGKYTRLDVRFQGVFCYVDAYQEPEPPKSLPRGWPETREEFLERLRNTPVHLFRLRHFRENVWGVAFYSYASEKYEASVYPSGSFEGPPEDAMEIAGEFHLQ